MILETAKEKATMKQISIKTTGILIRLIVMLVLILEQAACSKKSRSTLAPLTETEQVVITFADYDNNRSLYEPLMAEFHQQNPGITVQFVPLPESPSGGNDRYGQLASAADTSLVFTRIPEGSAYFLDLGSLIDSDASFQPNDFWPGLLSACQDTTGIQRGIPISINGFWGIFFNQEAFDAAGIPYPQPGWTWDDLQKTVFALSPKDNNAARYSLADQANFDQSILAPVVDAELTDAEGQIDPQKLKLQLQWYIDGVQNQTIYPIHQVTDWQQDIAQWNSLFLQKKPALWVGRLNDPMPGQTYSDSSNPLTNYAITHAGFIPFPSIETTDQTTPMMVTCASISAGTAHYNEAFLWLDYLSRQWNHSDTESSLIEIPARRSVAETTGYWNLLSTQVEQTVRFGLEHGWYGSRHPQVFEAVNNALLGSISGKTNLATALEDINTQDTAISDKSGNNADIIVATPYATPSNDVAQIVYYAGMQATSMMFGKSLTDEFHRKHPEILVQLLPDLQTMNPPNRGPFQAASDEADCFILNQGMSGDEVLPLDSFLAAEDTTFEEDFNPVLLAMGRINGNLYSLPLYSTPEVMFYNSDLLSKRGLQPPNVEWTFDDFIALSSSVASTKESDPSYGFWLDVYGSLPLFFAGKNVTSYDLSSQPWKVSFTSPDMTSLYTWLEDLEARNVISVYTYDNEAEQEQRFRSGQIAFWPGTAWSYNTATDHLPFKIGIVPLPITEGENNLMAHGAYFGQYISKKTKAPQACWEWMKYLTVQVSFSGMPARQSVSESSAWEAQVGKDSAIVYRKALEQASQFVFEANPLELPFSTWQSEAMVAVYQGSAPEQALTVIQQKADAYLTCIDNLDASSLSQTELWNKAEECAQQADSDRK